MRVTSEELPRRICVHPIVLFSGKLDFELVRNFYDVRRDFQVAVFGKKITSGYNKQNPHSCCSQRDTQLGPIESIKELLGTGRLPTNMFRRNNRSDVLPSTHYGTGRGGGGGGLPFSSGGGSLNDGSGKSIKMDAPVVKAWKKASGYTRGSYYALAATIFLVYYGFSSLRYWNCTSNFCLLDESWSKVVGFFEFNSKAIDASSNFFIHSFFH